MKFSLTAAIDYCNGTPHVGHAYEKIAGDAVARFQRLLGREPYYVMGNDEHSVNVYRQAQREGLSPQAYVDRMAGIFRDAWDRLAVSYSIFMQTSEPRHQKAVQTLVQTLYDRGHVYAGTYRGWYCASCEAFYTEKDVPSHVCPIHGRPVEYLEEPNYFFRLSRFRDEILRHIEAHPEFLQPEGARAEILAVLREGLQDVSISRSRTEWGVPLPWDPGHVVYVWFDALITYLTGMGYGWDEDRFARLWPADLHLIGKDISRFHAVIWPAMLLGAGLPLPRRIFVHGFITIRGEKLSKTTGNIIDPVPFAQRYGLDATRYYLLAEAPFGQDLNISPESFVKRVNGDLANDLGNLLHRTLAMVEQFSGGEVPAPREADPTLRAVAEEVLPRARRAYEELRFHEALDAVMQLVRRANKYIDEVAPWRLARGGPEERARLEAALYNLAETLRIAAIALSPVLVQAPASIFAQLGLSPADLAAARWEDTAFGGYPAPRRVQRGDPLFPRLDAQAVISRPEGFGSLAEEEKKEAPAAAAPETKLVDREEFGRLDLRVVDVVHAERVPGADRLLRLTVRLGEEERQVVAGLAAHYRPEDLVGMQAVLVANLRPARIRGVTSQGMLLAAVAADGTVRLVTPHERVPSGSVVR